jgi:hypothetical protein
VRHRLRRGTYENPESATRASPVSGLLIAVIALGVAAVIAWDTFCLRDLIRADPARVRHLPRWAWAAVCLITCPWGGLLYMIAGRGPAGSDQPSADSVPS